MSRIGVTGGTGELGRAAVRYLLDVGYSVRATYLTTAPLPLEADWARCDITRPDQVAAFMDGLDAVIHTAYDKSSGDHQRMVIVEGTRNVAEASRRAAARLVHVSTDVVFDGRLDRPYVEADEPTPLTAYGQAKADAEQVVAGIVPAAPLVRTSLLYSTDPRSHQMSLVDRALSPDADIEFFTDEFRCPAHVDDVARVLVDLVNSSHAGPLHAGGRDRLSRLDFARLLATAGGLDAGRLRSRPMGTDAETRPADITLDSSRCERVLGHAPRGATELLG